MTILSLPAVARLAERHVLEHGPLPATSVLAWLKSIDVDPDRATAGVRLAVICGRLEPGTGDTLAAPASRHPRAVDSQLSLDAAAERASRPRRPPHSPGPGDTRFDDVPLADPHAARGRRGSTGSLPDNDPCPKRSTQ